jgi:glycogen debranching enzyme
MQRDEAYHNGTVWSWLMGPFLDAYLRVHENCSDAIAQARRWLAPLIDHLDAACLGQINEIFEGDDPHRPVGCFAQAWSVAEVLRLAVKLGM